MTEEKGSVGISKGMFVAGIVVAILISSLASTVASLMLSVGPKGDKGDQGIQGPQGVQGLQGIQGIQGRQGLQGEQGLVGPQGPLGNFTIEEIAGLMSRPAYDSGWVQIDTRGSPYIIEHNLNTTEVLIYAYQHSYLWIGYHYMPFMSNQNRIWWCNLTDTTLWVYATPYDSRYPELDQFRIMMWVLPEP